MPDEYDTRTTRIEVDGDCPECGSSSLSYARNVTRTYQLHISCESCGTTIKSKIDPTGLFTDAGVEYEEIIQRVDILEFDLDAMLRLDEVAAGSSSVEVDSGDEHASTQ